MNTEHVKMSKIMEHSRNQQTDGLYNPLRNALNKSGMPFNAKSHQSSRSSLTPDKLERSHITHDIKMLSASQAQRIRKTTFIPTEKELVPTNHLQKVAGKHFYAVDVQQKIGDPLTGSQFDRYPKNQVNQIVYEYRDAQGNPIFPSYRGQIYQSFTQDKSGGGYIANKDNNLLQLPGNSYQHIPGNNGINSTPFSKQNKTAYQPFTYLQHNSFREEKTNSFIPFTQQKINNSQPFINQRTQHQINFNNNSPFSQEKTFLTTQPSYQPKNMSDLRVNSSPSRQQDHHNYSQLITNRNKDANDSVIPVKRPTLVGLKTNEWTNQQVRKKPKKVSHLPQYSNSSSQLQSLGSSGVKTYKFDKKMTSARNGNRTELQARKKGDYKYNLFSMLDEAGNKGCKTGCWVDNQLIAARRNRVQWNQ